MPEIGVVSPFPGVLYDGDGTRLAGDGPDTFSPEMDADLPFKAFIRDSTLTRDEDVLALGDRLWVLPERFTMPAGPPTLLICHLAGMVRAGRKVRLASTDELTCLHAKDLLMLTLADAKGEA